MFSSATKDGFITLVILGKAEENGRSFKIITNNLL